MSREVSVPAIPERAHLQLSPARTAAPRRLNERAAATRIASHVPVDRPQLAFVNSSAHGALATLDRVASVAELHRHRDLSEQRLRAGAAHRRRAIVRGIGTRVFWVQTGGFDTHAGQGNAGAGAYANLMGTFGDGVRAFYNDLRNQGLLERHAGAAVLGVRPPHLRERQPGHRPRRRRRHDGDGRRACAAASTAPPPSLDPNPANPTLENNGGDVRYETDFRSVYARVLDNWLGANSTAILGGDFRAGAPAII